MVSSGATLIKLSQYSLAVGEYGQREQDIDSKSCLLVGDIRIVCCRVDEPVTFD